METEASVLLPVVANIEEAQEWADDFKSVLTVGPSKSEVEWGHPNHRIYQFGDVVSGRLAPKREQIEEAVFWGAEQEDLLIHCHAGMSRSTATAWGVAIARGADPFDAFIQLKEAQPVEQSFWRPSKMEKREFIPNRKIVEILEDIFSLDSLMAIRLEHATQGWN